MTRSPQAPRRASSPTPGAIRAVDGERLRYRIAFSGIEAGRFSTRVRHRDGEVVLRARGGTLGVFDLVYPVSASAESTLGAGGRPEAFTLDCSEAGRQRDRRVHFGERTILWWREGDHTSQAAAQVTTQDPLDPVSFLFALRSTALEANTDFEVVAGPRADCYRVRYLGRADLTVPAGRFENAVAYSIEISPILSHSEPWQTGEVRARFEVFLASDEARTSLLLRRKLKLGTLTVELTSRGTLQISRQAPAEP